MRHARPRVLRLLAGTAVAATVAGVALAQPVSAPPAAPQQLQSSRLSTDRNDLDMLITRFDAEEKALREEQTKITPELEVTHKRVIARGRRYYQFVRAGLLPAGGGFDALVDHATEMERLRMALTRDLNKERALVRRHDAIRSELERLRAERAPYEVHKQAMAEARDTMRQAEERRDAFKRAFENSAGPPDSVTIYGADVGPEDDGVGNTFAARKGHLLLPVAGRAEVRRVHHPAAAGPGLELTAPAGAVARTVAAGRVVFADHLDDYGKTVLIDHGDHYYTLYANLETIDVAVGEALPAGQRIATVYRATEQSVLYFELRVGRDLVDPGPWLGLG